MEALIPASHVNASKHCGIAPPRCVHCPEDAECACCAWLRTTTGLLIDVRPIAHYTVAEETDDPTHADRRNFYKVEKWSRDGQRV